MVEAFLIIEKNPFIFFYMVFVKRVFLNNNLVSEKGLLLRRSFN